MSSVTRRESADPLVSQGDELARRGEFEGALERYRAAGGELSDGALAAKLARVALAAGDVDVAGQALRRFVDVDDSFRLWSAAISVLDGLPAEALADQTTRRARAFLTGSYNTVQLAPILRLAAFRAGVLLDVRTGGYAQYQQEVLDPASDLYASDPDFVIFAVHEGAVQLPALSDAPDDAVRDEVARWRSLWSQVLTHSRARPVHHLVASRFETPFGHLARRLPGSRYTMLAHLNAALAEAARDDVLLVDCDRLAAMVGKRRWFDDRYWHLSKQAVALDALPLLARHTAAVIAGDTGLARKCLVLDLDNTIWGGVIGEDGLAGLQLGDGPQGEAYAAFQDAVLALKERGVILAVCSKNNEADAFGVFDEHPEMRIKRDDIAVFAANWDAKPANIRVIAERLRIGLDAIVYVDDNPAERELVRRTLPEVDVLDLPADPALYARALYEYPYFETSTFSREDASRSDQYRLRAAGAEMRAAAVDLESFLRDLDMRATIAPFDELHLPRIVQLIGKTNQFNLTTRRHGLSDVRSFVADPECAHYYLKLRDRFGDHGLVGVAIAFKRGDVLDVDTFLLSCRVIGRTAEAALLGKLCHAAAQLGCGTLRATYIPTAKNGPARDFLGASGFTLVGEGGEGTATWEYDLRRQSAITSDFVTEETPT